MRYVKSLGNSLSILHVSSLFTHSVLPLLKRHKGPSRGARKIIFGRHDLGNSLKFRLRLRVKF